MGFGEHHGGIACNDIASGLGEKRDHFLAHGLVNKLLQSSFVQLIHGELLNSHDGGVVMCWLRQCIIRRAAAKTAFRCK